MTPRNFLSRWAQHKAARRYFNQHRATNAGGTQDRTPDLPNLDSLTRDSDFTVFLDQRVDPLLRRQALRRLWRLEPALCRSDGLVEYNEDFSDAAKVPAVMRTAYRVITVAAA